MNCHLLVPDLLHAAGDAIYGGSALPALETLLARGALTRRAGVSLERWLAATFRIVASPDLPLAALSLLGDGGEPGDACWLRADPCHLRVHGDQLLLADAGVLMLTARESAELTGALNAHFTEHGLEFIAMAPPRWYVRLRDEPRIRTTPAAEAVGQPIGSLLPQGDDGPRWRRIINEAQMLLHDHPCNQAREARGDPPVNSIWPWGAGRTPAIPRDAPYRAIWSSHPLAAGIARAGGLRLHALPQSASRILDGATGHAEASPQLLVLDALQAGSGGLEGWRTALAAMEERWFAPLVDALKRGTLSSLTLHGLGADHSCTVTATRFDPLKFWRARRALSHYAAG